MEELNENVDGIKKSIEHIIGSSTHLKRKKKTELDIQKEQFCKIITSLEEVYNRSVLIGNDLDIDLSTYDEKFWAIIDSFIVMHWGKELSEVIFFYIYERIGPDGEPNYLLDDDNNEIFLSSPEELWSVLQTLKNNKK